MCLELLRDIPSRPLIILLRKTLFLFRFILFLACNFIEFGLLIACCLLSAAHCFCEAVTFLIVTMDAWYFTCCVCSFTGSPYIYLNWWLSPPQTRFIAGINCSGMISPEMDVKIEFGVYLFYLGSAPVVKRRQKGVKYMFSRQNFAQSVKELQRKTDRGMQLSLKQWPNP